jgi:membrane-associated phospholipid phosphatase
MAIITLGLALLVARRARSLRPLLVPILTFGLTTAVTYVFKFGVDRAAPRSPLPHAVELGSGGESYPAGHLVVAIVWYGAIVALLDRLVVLPRWLRIVIRVAPPIIVTATTIYVRFHWLTDDLAGIMLGALLDRLLGRLPSGLPPPRSAG